MVGACSRWLKLVAPAWDWPLLAGSGFLRLAGASWDLLDMVGAGHCWLVEAGCGLQDPPVEWSDV